MATKARIDLIGRDKTKAAFRSAEGSLKRFRSAALGVGAVLTTGLFVRATKGAIDFADSIDKAAKAAGVSAEFLQEMRFAGDQLGVSTKQVDEGFRRFTRRLGEFAKSGEGPAKRAIKSLGIEINDTKNKFRGSEAIFRDFVAEMQKFDSFAKQSAVSAQIFGDDAGPKLALLIAKGTDGLAKLRQEARDIGAVMSNDVIATAVDAKDAMAKLSSVLGVQMATALGNLAPLLTAAANKIVKLTGAWRNFFNVVGGSSAVSLAQDRISDLNTRIEGMRTRLESPVSKLFGQRDELRSQISALSDEVFALDDALVALDKRQASVKTDTTGPAIASPVGLEKSQDAFTKWKTTIIDVGAETQDLQRKVTFLDEAMLSGAISTESHRIALERLTGKQSQQAGEVEKALDRTGEKAAEVSKGAVDMGFAFESAFEDAVLGGEEFSDVLDGLLKDLQKVALRQLITAPAGNALSAGISRTFPGFATGGSFRVGGSGGTDSQLVAFKASPGEHVAVSRGGQEDGGTTVNVINNSGATAEVKRSNDSGGRELINVIIGQVASNISSGGQVAQAMQGTFGMRRTGILRT